MIKLSDEQKSVLDAGLKKSGCPFCKSKGPFKFTKEVFALQAHEDVSELGQEELESLKVGTIETVPVECDKCGYIMLFNYRTLFK